MPRDERDGDGTARGHSTVNTARPAGTSVGERRELADYRSVEPCHVLVLTEAGRVPGLLLEWRKPLECPWEGLVALVRQHDGASALVREWLPAAAIEKV